MNNVAEIIGRWPSRRDALEDARECEPGLQIVAVHRWCSRSSIPGKYWSSLIAGAERREIELTPLDLMNAHSPEIEASQ